MPIRHQSGRSDISSDRGHTSPGSYPSTMEAPPSNQDGLHRIQVIQRTQEVFGRTLKVINRPSNHEQARSFLRYVTQLEEIEYMRTTITKPIPAFLEVPCDFEEPNTPFSHCKKWRIFQNDCAWLSLSK